MKLTNYSFLLAASLVLLPLLSVQGQESLKEPGTFDPQTSSARQGTPAENVPLPELPSLLPPAVKQAGKVIVPASSVVRPEDKGQRAHTNHLVFVPASGSSPAAITNAASATDLRAAAAVVPAVTFAENPGSIACVYGLISYAGCTPSGGFSHRVTSGGSGSIAIVDAYDNPDAAADLAYFDSYWGLPAANFTQVYCQPYPGTCYTTNAKPAVSTGWGLEEALDIEYSHAMAPAAKIFLIEAASNSWNDLTWAVAWAGWYVANNGGGEVSNSYGGGEFSTEVNYDQIFNNYYNNYHPVVYLASGGDSGVIEYPSASPYVISAGGTTINRDSSGNYLSQACWAGTGRGVSAYEAIPSDQSVVGGIAGTKRPTNDVSSDADPASGVWVYDILNGGWFEVGGTSVASPTLAGIINQSGNFFNATLNEGNVAYSEFRGRADYLRLFTDVAPAGYDNCTGIGAPKSAPAL